ncbi:hypothetical protein [Numidum massiliense]|uniref:hypothetical protein n=1 Tax=Numidum massiliense TaxID=1522315 RepID=UPI0011CA196B|nr:hypothetical protein [Numidum massiliense]
MRRMRRLFEGMARGSEGIPRLRQRFDHSFRRFMDFATRPINVFRASETWCEESWLSPQCVPPNGRFCDGCPPDGRAKCPQGYRVSHAWNYVQTGCWCIAAHGAPRTAVCCDCTPYSPWQRSAHDCGCRHEIAEW